MRISDWSSDVCSSDLIDARTIASRGKLVTRSAIAAATRSRKSASGEIRIDSESSPCSACENRSIAIQRGSELPSLMTTISLGRSEQHTSELQSLMRISYAVFCLKKKKYII